MRFDYRDDQLAVQGTVRDFARGRLAPNAERWGEAGTFPLELLHQLPRRSGPRQTSPAAPDLLLNS